MRSSNTPKIIFLRDFYERLGAHWFGPQWDGSEINSTEMIPFEDALEIRSKLNEAMAELQSHYKDNNVDKNFVNYLIEMDHNTGVLRTKYIDMLEINKGSGTRGARTIYELVSEIAHASSRLEASLASMMKRLFDRRTKLASPQH